VRRSSTFSTSSPRSSRARAQGAGIRRVRYTIDYTDPEKGILRDLTIKGQPVDPNATYTLVTNDYLMGGGDGYVVLKKQPWRVQHLGYAPRRNYRLRAGQEVLTPAPTERIALIAGSRF
jgi:2',3'-cyclic-nucleotide 2'-phosphodiesterase (5'-nucleotidase family)